MNSVEMGAKTKGIAAKNINFAKNRMLRLKGDRSGTSHGTRVQNNHREKPYIDQFFVLSNLQAQRQNNALYQSTENMNEAVRRGRIPASFSWSKPDLALCSQKKPGSAVSLVTYSESFMSKRGMHGSHEMIGDN